MTVPVLWLAKEGVCSRCRMDEWIVEDWLDGAQKRPVPDFVPEHHMVTSLEGLSFGQAIVVLPGFGHAEDVDWVNSQLAWVAQLTLIITSDEGQHFPVDKLSHPDMVLWLQTPRPETKYPEGTRFFGVGSGRAWRHVRPREATNWVFLAGQNTHERRKAAFANVERIPGAVSAPTEAFLTGMERTAYLSHMNETTWAPCPSGVVCQDSFRFWEALECGALPVPDALRPDEKGRDFWTMVAPGLPLAPIENWNDLPALVAHTPTPRWSALYAHAWWHTERRNQIRALTRSAGVAQGRGDGRMTVIIPTSPIPSHPSLKMIDETVRSIRDRTSAEILIMCDGIRPEQRKMEAQYLEYLRQLLQKAEADWWNVTPTVFGRHLHQARMTQLTMQMVDTEYVMFVEHDTPLVNKIDFNQIITTMAENRLNVMRFSHEARVLEDHEPLMAGPVQPGHWRPTMQWSQRPHVARSDFYEKLLTECFAADANVMIEDVVHGVVDHARRTLGPQAWAQWRIGLWHPKGNIQRSTHLDGREGESKFEHRFHYSYPQGVDGRPDGAPHPSVGI